MPYTFWLWQFSSMGIFLFTVLYTQLCILHWVFIIMPYSEKLHNLPPLAIWPFSGLCDAPASSVCNLWTLSWILPSLNSALNHKIKMQINGDIIIIIRGGGQITQFKWKSHPIKLSCSMHFSRTEVELSKLFTSALLPIFLLSYDDWSVLKSKLIRVVTQKFSRSVSCQLRWWFAS